MICAYFYELTVVTDVPEQASLFRDEIFGPVLPITNFEDVDRAIAQANSTRYGLSAYVWTKDIHMAIRTAERL